MDTGAPPSPSSALEISPSTSATCCSRGQRAQSLPCGHCPGSNGLKPQKSSTRAIASSKRRVDCSIGRPSKSAVGASNSALSSVVSGGRGFSSFAQLQAVLAAMKTMHQRSVIQAQRERRSIVGQAPRTAAPRDGLEAVNAGDQALSTYGRMRPGRVRSRSARRPLAASLSEFRAILFSASAC